MNWCLFSAGALALITVTARRAGGQSLAAACDTLTTTIDREECLKPLQDSANAVVLRAAGRALELLPDGQREHFLIGDTSWWDYRERECRSVIAFYYPGTIAGEMFARCEIRTAEERASLLSDEFNFAAMDPANHGGCVGYAPDTVALTGTLERRTYPGPPNFKSVRHGDEAETGFYLVLPQGMCVSRHLDLVNEPAAGVRRIQLLLDQPGYERLRPHLTTVVTVRGKLSHSITGHHHATLLLQVIR